MNHYSDLYHLATEEEKAKGLVWYDEARAYAEGLAAKYDLSREQVTGIIAALSPRCPWNKNAEQARDFIKTKGTSKTTTYYSNKAKALDILEGCQPEDILKGPKTRAFYDNILNPQTSSEVTIDTIMIRAFFNDPNYDEKVTFGRPTELRQIKQTVEALALEYGIRPLQMQAILWQVWKRITDTKPFTNIVNYEKLLQ